MRTNTLLTTIVLALTLGVASPALAQDVDTTYPADTEESDNSGLWGLFGLLGGLGLLGLKRRNEDHRVRTTTAPGPAGAY